MKTIRWALVILMVSMTTLSAACGAGVETESPEPAGEVEEPMGDDPAEEPMGEDPEELEEEMEETEAE